MEAFNLSEDNKTQLWVPPGFAHGFQVISSEADFEYKCTQYYDPKDEKTLLWNDPDLELNGLLKIQFFLIKILMNIIYKS